MINLNTYILEKLKITKDTKVDSSIKSKYHIGDKCLYITYVRETKSSHPNFITIDVVEIQKITKDCYICKYLTTYEFGNTSNIEKLHFKYTYDQDPSYKFTWTYVRQNRDGVLIPNEYCEEVIEYIENNNCKISFYDLCKNKYKNAKYSNLVVEMYSSAKSLIWKNITGLKSGSIKNIKNKLGL